MENYSKVLRKIDKEMTAKGYAIDYVTDGEERFYAKDHSKKDLYENALACDIGSMSYQDNAGNRVSFYLVYGNKDYETIADAGWNSPKAEKDLDDIFEAVYKAYDPDYCPA